MRFEYRQINDLPRLAWCARLTKGDETIVVRHGPWVETRDDCFFEGAWNGAFGEGRFDTADTFVGSGGRLTQDGVLFSSPTHPVERIYSIRCGNNLIVSNSWVFLLVSTGDQPNLGYADYFFDLRDNFRGWKHIPTTLCTQNGHSISLVDIRNMMATIDLKVQYAAKRQSRAPQTYTQLEESYQGAVDLVIDNAADPARRQRYRPVAMTSTGYDSAAASALAAKGGCAEAVTFARLYREGPDTGDDGSQIAQALGMDAKTYVRFDYLHRSDFPEAEFCGAGPMNWTPVSAMENALAGSLLFAGLHGYYWQEQSYKVPPYSILCIGSPVFPFTGITEYRLRAGFMLFPALHIGGIHDAAIRRITNSEEMRPWMLPDSYRNVPILRRIVEDAGVDRAMFGQQKRANAFSNLAAPGMFSPASQSDFTDFCRSHGLPTTRDSSLNIKINGRLSRTLERTGSKLLAQMPEECYFHIMPYTWWLYPRPSHPLWRSPALYTFHWGFERTKRRYLVD